MAIVCVGLLALLGATAPQEPGPDVQVDHIAAALRSSIGKRDQRTTKRLWSRFEHALAAQMHKPDADRGKLARLCLPVVKIWLDRVAPQLVLGSLRREHDRVGKLLANLEPTERRSVLAKVVERSAKHRSLTSLDVLVGAVDWDALLLGRDSTGRASLDALSTDLVLVFTERSPDGMRESGSPHYRSGRTRDTGFARELRDGSDQVRHFCWAMRLFAVSKNLPITEAVLRLKEVDDARRRKTAGLNEADLRLNNAARRFVEEVRPAIRANDASQPRPGVALGQYSRRIRRLLAPPTGKR